MLSTNPKSVGSSPVDPSSFSSVASVGSSPVDPSSFSSVAAFRLCIVLLFASVVLVCRLLTSSHCIAFFVDERCRTCRGASFSVEPDEKRSENGDQAEDLSSLLAKHTLTTVRVLGTFPLSNITCPRGRFEPPCHVRVLSAVPVAKKQDQIVHQLGLTLVAVDSKNKPVIPYFFEPEDESEKQAVLRGLKQKKSPLQTEPGVHSVGGGFISRLCLLSQIPRDETMLIIFYLQTPVCRRPSSLSHQRTSRAGGHISVEVKEGKK